MLLTINPNLPIKYSLGLHQGMPNYPTQADFMFDVITYLLKTLENKGLLTKNTDIDLKFSVKTLKYVFGERLKSEEFVESIKNVLTDLVESGDLIKTGEYVSVTRDALSQYYLIS